MQSMQVSVAHLPLKIVHGFPRRAGMTYEEKCAAVTEHLLMLQRKGFGGVVSNVNFDNYTRDETEWNLFRFLADECERLGMRLWIYDEKGYPSGGAGGLTLEADSDYEATGVIMVTSGPVAPGEEATLPLPHGHMHFLYAALYPCAPDGTLAQPEHDDPFSPVAVADCYGSTVPVTLKNNAPVPALLCAFVQKRLYEGTHCVHNVSECRRYVDVTNKDAIREFIRNTYEKYATAVPEHMNAGAGRITPLPGQVEAFFTDEPSFMGCYINAGLWPSNVHDPYDTEIPLYPVLSFGRDAENQFAARYGYALAPELISIFCGSNGHAKQVRLDYYTLLSDLYEESFFAQLSDWCYRNHVSFSGHILLEDDMRMHTVFEGNFFSLLRHMHTPGIDMLQSIPSLVRRDAFTPKLVSSVAHAYHRPHVMSEVSAHAQGGKVTYDQMYASLCAQYALGVDTFTYYYGENFMDDDTYTHYNAALGRMDAVMAGDTVADVAVFYPIETMRMHHRPSDAQYGAYTEEENACWNGVSAIMNTLLDRQICFEFMDLDVLSRCTVTESRCILSPSGAEMTALVLPPMEMTTDIQAQLDRLSRAGARVLSLTDEHFAPIPSADQFALVHELADRLVSYRPSLYAVTPVSGVLTLLRNTPAGPALLICNTNECDTEVTLHCDAFRTQPVLYDPMADERSSAPLSSADLLNRCGTVRLPGYRTLIIMEEK